MKKIGLLLLLFFVFSCAPNLDEVIIGQWKIDNIKIENIDEVVKKFYQLRKQDLEKYIEDYQQQLQMATDTTEKKILQNQIELKQQELNNLSEDSIKLELEENMEDMKDKIFVFNSDNTFSYIYPQLGGLQESGTWVLLDDNNTLRIQINGVSTDFQIPEFSKEKLVLKYTEAKGDIQIKYALELSKIEQKK